MIDETCYWVFCFAPLSRENYWKIFGFSEFLTALALLVVVFTIVDVRYKFRTAITPGHLHLATFLVIVGTGLQTLLTEVWLVQEWLVPRTWGLSRFTWQGIFGGLFLATFLTWMYYAFIRPPIFGRRNAKKYAQVLYSYVLRGNDDELKVIANEVARSAVPLIKLSRRLPNKFAKKDLNSKAEPVPTGRPEDYAHDVLLLIANRKLCRHIVEASPITAQYIFEEMAHQKKFDIPVGQFARNISVEALAQKGSFVFEEAEGYDSGLLGYLKPVSLALFGNYQLVEALAAHVSSPLDIPYQDRERWDGTQWEAYCRVILITFESYLVQERGGQHSFALYRAFHDISPRYSSTSEFTEDSGYHESVAYARLRAVTGLLQKATDLIDKQANPPFQVFRNKAGNSRLDTYELIADLMFDTCVYASRVKSAGWANWDIQHNIVWNAFFSHHEGKAWNIVRHRLRRKLYDEIALLSSLPNFENGPILGFCLNVMGLRPPSRGKSDRHRSWAALAIAAQAWTKANYLRLREANSEVADSVLVGKLSFDAGTPRIAKTYEKGLSKVAPTHFLILDGAPSAPNAAPPTHRRLLKKRRK